MDYDTRNNPVIAQELEDSSLVLSVLEKGNLDSTLTTINGELSRIDSIAQDYGAPSLRALVHWMTLNTEYDESTKSKIRTLLNEDAFTKWIDILCSLLRDYDQSNLPVLHQSLTSPDWIIKPSAPLLKSLAIWIGSFKSIEKNKQIASNDEDDLTVHDKQSADDEAKNVASSDSRKMLIEEQEEPESRHVFEEINHEILEKEYDDDSAEELLSELKEHHDTQNELVETDKTSLLTIEEPEIPLLDDDFTDLLFGDNSSAEEKVDDTETDIQEFSDYDDSQDLSIEIDDIVMSLISIDTSTKGISGHLREYESELDRLSLLAEISSKPSISDVAEWSKRNISLICENLTEANEFFVTSGMAWSWVERINAFIEDKQNTEHQKALIENLQSEEWPEPIEPKLLESLLKELDIDFDTTIESKNNVGNEQAIQEADLIDDLLNETSAIHQVDTDETTEKETSGLQIKWDEDTHPELLTVFLDETPKQIEELDSLVTKIVVNSATKEERKTASRMAHTIKGSAGIVGVTALYELAYQLEQILDVSVDKQLPDELITLLPQAVQSLEALFEAMQSQQGEPESFFPIYKQLADFVENLDDSGFSDLTLNETPELPDFIRNQNSEPSKTELDESNSILASEIESDISDDLDTATLNNIDITDTDIQDFNIDSIDQADIEASNDLNNEIDDIVMSLASISASSNDIFSSIEEMQSELQRFSVLTEISGCPSLTTLSDWCSNNLKAFEQTQTNDIKTFLTNGNCWAWIEILNTSLKEPEEISHLSLLSTELMRPEWQIPLPAEDLQSILMSLREHESVHNETINNADSLEESDNVDDKGSKNESTEESTTFATTPEIESNPENENSVISWDKDVHPELLEIYFQETPDQIANVAALLHKISKGKANKEDHKLAARIAHTIKGASGVVGINSLVELTHKLEDLLEFSVSNELPEETADLIAESSDCLESLFETIQAKQERPEEYHSVLNRLADLVDSLDGAATPDTIDENEDLTELFDVMDTLEEESIESENPNNTETGIDTHSSVSETHIRVPVKVIDRLLNLAGELVTTSTQVSDHLEKTLETSKTIKTQDQRVHNMLDELSKTICHQEKDQSRMLSNLESSDFDALEMDTYNELHSVAGLLTESILDSEAIDRTLNAQLNTLNDDLRSLGKLNKELSEVILNSRMVSINTLIPRLERIVRQTCRKTDKQAKLEITGNDINIDTDILNGLIDPLLHLLRNAVDHGIEDPKARKKHKKDETGSIKLNFLREGNNIIMRLEDDGAGIDPKKVFKSAVEKGLIKNNAKLSNQEKLKLILQPGFSTQEKVTDISGRGVGMDIVNNAIENLKGTLNIDSQVKKGTRFEVVIPLTLVSSNTLLVSASGNPIAIPTDDIDQLFYLSPEDLIEKNDKHFIKHENKELPIISLSNLLGWPVEGIDFSQSHTLLIIKSNNAFHAVHIDEIIHSREVVIKHLSPWVDPSKGIVGACHLNDGAVAPVLNLPHILKELPKTDKQTDKKPSNIEPNETVKTQELSNTDENQTILVVDDSLSNRKALSLIIEQTEYQVLSAVDGLDALQIMNENTVDLVFTDLEMPRMNGLEFTQAVRAWDDKKDIPVVMITSRSTNKHRELAKKAGVNDYLTKPVVTEILLESINTWLKQTVSA